MTAALTNKHSVYSQLARLNRTTVVNAHNQSTFICYIIRDFYKAFSIFFEKETVVNVEFVDGKVQNIGHED